LKCWENAAVYIFINSYYIIILKQSIYNIILNSNTIM